MNTAFTRQPTEAESVRREVLRALIPGALAKQRDHLLAVCLKNHWLCYARWNGYAHVINVTGDNWQVIGQAVSELDAINNALTAASVKTGVAV